MILLSNPSELTREIYEAPDGPKIGAFFDFDGTLIAGYSAFPFLKAQLRAGLLSPGDLRDVLTAMANFQLGKVEFEELLKVTAEIMKGADEDQYIEFGEKVYRKHLAKLVYPETRKLIEAHLEKGHTVALISSATRRQVVFVTPEVGAWCSVGGLGTMVDHLSSALVELGLRCEGDGDSMSLENWKVECSDCTGSGDCNACSGSGTTHGRCRSCMGLGRTFNKSRCEIRRELLVDELNEYYRNNRPDQQ